MAEISEMIEHWECSCGETGLPTAIGAVDCAFDVTSDGTSDFDYEFESVLEYPYNPKFRCPNCQTYVANDEEEFKQKLAECYHKAVRLDFVVDPQGRPWRDGSTDTDLPDMTHCAELVLTDGDLEAWKRAGCPVVHRSHMSPELFSIIEQVVENYDESLRDDVEIDLDYEDEAMELWDYIRQLQMYVRKLMYRVDIIGGVDEDGDRFVKVRVPLVAAGVATAFWDSVPETEAELANSFADVNMRVYNLRYEKLNASQEDHFGVIGFAMMIDDLCLERATALIDDFMERLQGVLMTGGVLPRSDEEELVAVGDGVDDAYYG